MNTAARKAKGRSGQQEVIGFIMRYSNELELIEGDLKSTPMSSSGPDINGSLKAFKRLYFNIWEIKRRKIIGIIRWFEQALRALNKKNIIEPRAIVCFREDRGEWYCMTKLEDLLKLLIQAKH